MKLVSYRHGEQTRIGAVSGNWLVDLNRAYREILKRKHPRRAMELANCWIPGDMTRFLEGGDEALGAARAALEFAEERLASQRDLEGLRKAGAVRSLSEVRLAPPAPQPGKIVCIGKNYADHARELGGETPSLPELFVRFASTLVAPGEPILKPLATDMWDYEAELAVVIGKGGRRIPREKALSHVAGYSCFNDVSARDFQKRITQWTAGKNFDSSGPMGPYLTTADEVGDPQCLDIRLTIGAQAMQVSNTRHMIFPVDFLVAHISEFATLAPGDIIATGTPGGVGMGRKPPRYLKPGETVCVEIERVGRLENPVVAEQ
jgi:acylpyruvate hydrolase